MELLYGFIRSFALLELQALCEAAADVQANLQVFTECLEDLLTYLPPLYIVQLPPSPPHHGPLLPGGMAV